MWKLVPIFLFSLLMAGLAERNSVYEIGEFGEKQYIRKDKICFTIMTAAMAVFVGLRTNYNDTFTYRYAYELMVTDVSGFADIDWAIGSNPGFALVNACLRILRVSTQSFLMLYAVVTVCIYLWFIRKYSKDLWFSVFLFSVMGCYTFTMAAIKQCVAVAFCLIATDRAIQRKWIPFVLWILLASTFHPYALIYLAAPFLMFAPWSQYTYWMLTVFAIAGFSLRAMLGTIVSVTSIMGEEYDLSSFSGEGVNVFRLAVIWVPIIISFMVRRLLAENEDRAAYLMVNLTMLNGEIMFIALFGTANYFARLANYFLIFQTVALPLLLKFFNEKSQKIIKFVAVTCYMLYFIYANAINQPFDELFKRISLFEYLKMIT